MLTPPLPVVVITDKDAYVGTDHITVTLESRDSKTIWVEPFLPFERSNGDDTWSFVYKLRNVAKCPEEPPQKNRCVKLKPNERLTLAPWDWNTGGYDQCPPRRPGHRAFKGVHRITLTECKSRLGKKKAPRTRVKLVTWE